DRIRLLRTWAQLGAELLADRRQSARDWKAARRLIEAVRPKLQFDAQQLRNLLKQSRKRLHPLEDPFDVDVGLHRWLASDREEANSDWLEWVNRKVESPAEA